MKHPYVTIGESAGVILYFSLAAIAGGMQAQKPVKEVTTWVDRAGPAIGEDLQTALQRVDDVAEIRILKPTLRPLPVKSVTYPPPPTRFFEAQIVATYKQSRVMGPSETIVIEQPGGEVEGPAEITKYVDPSFPALEVGRQYILYLKWNPSSGAYSIVYGPDGTFEISGTVVRSPGKSPMTLAQAKLTAQSLRGEIRRAATGRPGADPATDELSARPKDLRHT